MEGLRGGFGNCVQEKKSPPQTLNVCNLPPRSSPALQPHSVLGPALKSSCSASGPGAPGAGTVTPPPPFSSSSSSAYIFDVRSGFFYHHESKFFYDPKTDLYYSAVMEGYFKMGEDGKLEEVKGNDVEDEGSSVPMVGRKKVSIKLGGKLGKGKKKAKEKEGGKDKVKGGEGGGRGPRRSRRTGRRRRT